MGFAGAHERMHLPTLRLRTFAAVMMTILVATVLSAGAMAAPGADYSTFTTGAPTVDPFDTNPKATFSLNKQDSKALKASQRATKLREEAATIRVKTDVYQRRIEAIQRLIDDAQGEEDRLQSAIAARLVDAYERGDHADLSFVLASGSVRDLVSRIDIVSSTRNEQADLIDEHQVTLDRLSELERALQELRDAQSEQAAVLEDEASTLDNQLDTALAAHRAENQQPLVPKNKGDGDGTGMWFSLNGDVPMSLLMSLANPVTQPYNGGTRTPPRPASPFQIMQLLNDPRIDIYAGGRGDIQAGRIDGRVLDALLNLADRFGSVAVTSLMSGHGVYTSSGNISEHSVGCAVDIGSVGGVRIQPSTQGQGSMTEFAVKFLASLEGDLSPHQVISLNSYGGPTLAMGDHGDHIHLGYNC